MLLSDDFNLDALKDTYDYSCFRARSHENRHLMTYSPSASSATATVPARCAQSTTWANAGQHPEAWTKAVPSFCTLILCPYKIIITYYP